MTIIYHYHPDHGAYLGAGTADPSPLEPEAILLPAHATLIAPPPAGARQIAVWQDGCWQLQPDFRAVALYATADGSSVRIDKLGVTPADIDATDTPRPEPGYVWCDGSWQPDAAASAAWLTSLRAARLAAINADCGAALAALTAAYPDGEVQSWGQQTQEALTLAADASAEAPLLTVIAAARGVPLALLAERVRDKVAAYAVSSGQLIGKRQALEDAVNLIDLAAPDAAAQLEAIQWPAA